MGRTGLKNRALGARFLTTLPLFWSFFNLNHKFMNGDPGFMNGGPGFMNGGPGFMNGDPGFMNGGSVGSIFDNSSIVLELFHVKP